MRSQPVRVPSYVSFSLSHEPASLLIPTNNPTRLGVFLIFRLKSYLDLAVSTFTGLYEIRTDLFPPHTVNRLKGLDVRIGLVSNTDSRMRE